MCWGNVIPSGNLFLSLSSSLFIYIFWVRLETAAITEVCLVVSVIMLCCNLYSWNFKLHFCVWHFFPCLQVLHFSPSLCSDVPHKCVFPLHYFCFQLWSSVLPVLSPAKYFCGCQKLPFSPVLVLLTSHLVVVYQTEHQAGWIVLAWVGMKIRHGECEPHLNVRVAEHSELLNWVAFVLISSGCIDVVEVK